MELPHRIETEVNTHDPASDLEKTQTQKQSEQQDADANQPVPQEIPGFKLHFASFLNRHLASHDIFVISWSAHFSAVLRSGWKKSTMRT